MTQRMDYNAATPAGVKALGVGPMFGQVGFFHKFAGREYEDKRPLQRYVAESKRLLGVMETHLAGRQWIRRRIHHRRHFDAWLGAQPNRLL
jgi:glutathione S-transferase